MQTSIFLVAEPWEVLAKTHNVADPVEVGVKLASGPEKLNLGGIGKFVLRPQEYVDPDMGWPMSSTTVADK